MYDRFQPGPDSSLGNVRFVRRNGKGSRPIRKKDRREGRPVRWVPRPVLRLLHSSIAEASIVQPQHRRIFNRNTAAIAREIQTMTMTTASNTHSASGLRDRVATLAERIRSEFEANRVYRQTRNELQSLSNRELADLGIARCSIRAIARDAADASR